MPKKVMGAIDERLATIPPPLERQSPKERQPLGYTVLARCCDCGREHRGSAEGKFIRQLHEQGWRYRESRSSDCDEAGWGANAGVVDFKSVCPDHTQEGDW